MEAAANPNRNPNRNPNPYPNPNPNPNPDPNPDPDQVEAAANRRAIDSLGRPPARQRRAAEVAPPFAAGLDARAPHAALLAELRVHALPPHAACAALQVVVGSSSEQ